MQNPGYALVDVDAETLLPINWRIFAMDLATANQVGEPEWYEMINYSNDYLSGTGLSPANMLDLANRMQTDSSLYWQLNWDKHRRVGEKTIGTDEEWQEGSLTDYCIYTSSSREQQAQCLGWKRPGSFADPLIGKWKVLASTENQY